MTVIRFSTRILSILVCINFGSSFLVLSDESQIDTWVCVKCLQPTCRDGQTAGDDGQGPRHDDQRPDAGRAGEHVRHASPRIAHTTASATASSSSASAPSPSSAPAPGNARVGALRKGKSMGSSLLTLTLQTFNATEMIYTYINHLVCWWIHRRFVCNHHGVQTFTLCEVNITSIILKIAVLLSDSAA